MAILCHASDWHGQTHPLPEADFYIFTGDMLPNGPKHSEDPRFQEEWIAEHWPRGDFRKYVLGNPGAPVVCVRGNHDFIDLIGLFEAPKTITHEIHWGDKFKIDGLTFAGSRGIKPIDEQQWWSDELGDAERRKAFEAIPNADIIITHQPPLGILDKAYGMCLGCDVLKSHLYMKPFYGNPNWVAPKAHLFGHIHECGGQTKHIVGLSTIFSNAATTYNLIAV